MIVTAALALALTPSTQDAKPRFEDEIAAFETADRAKPPTPGSVLFVGSSSIRMWSTLERDFPAYRVLNRGFGGSRIDDSVRLVDRIVVPYKPRAIVFFAGTNDLADGQAPKEVFDQYREFVSRVRTAFPRLPILYIAISPAPSRQALWPKMRETNALIREYAKRTPGLQFVDIVPAMLTRAGGPRPELFGQDQLHMNAQGYAIWTKAVNAALARPGTFRR